MAKYYDSDWELGSETYQTESGHIGESTQSHYGDFQSETHQIGLGIELDDNFVVQQVSEDGQMYGHVRVGQKLVGVDFETLERLNIVTLSEFAGHVMADKGSSYLHFDFMPKRKQKPRALPPPTTTMRNYTQETNMLALAADGLFFGLTTIALGGSHWLNLLAVTPLGAPTGNLTQAPGATFVNGHLGIFTECMSTTGSEKVCVDADSHQFLRMSPEIDDVSDINNLYVGDVAKGCLIVAIILSFFAFWITFREVFSSKTHTKEHDNVHKWNLFSTVLRIVCFAVAGGGGFNFLVKKREALDNLNFADVALDYSAGAHIAAEAIYGLFFIFLAFRACYCKPYTVKQLPERQYPVRASDVEQTLAN